MSKLDEIELAFKGTQGIDDPFLASWAFANGSLLIRAVRQLGAYYSKLDEREAWAVQIDNDVLVLIGGEE